MADKPKFGTKKAAPFKKDGGRDPKYPNDSTGKTKPKPK